MVRSQFLIPGNIGASIQMACAKHICKPWPVTRIKLSNLNPYACKRICVHIDLNTIQRLRDTQLFYAPSTCQHSHTSVPEISFVDVPHENLSKSQFEGSESFEKQVPHRSSALCWSGTGFDPTRSRDAGTNNRWLQKNPLKRMRSTCFVLIGWPATLSLCNDYCKG